MDDAESKAKKRLLPSWMTEDSAACRGSRSSETRRRKTAPRRRTVYCMNERELVECALEILDQGRERRDGEESTKAELQDHREDPVSDTDSQKKPLTPRPIPPSSDHPRKDSDDDALKYVREIFFS
ncbi:cell cycle regulator of non-homologous end joining [Eleutherodactylus coqui]|uniref:cell cycle regulator of non-homologous end joining n=1 Tax=Eleutherodactylus coqui TaxID=57060 RepID=UPI0034637363